MSAWRRLDRFRRDETGAITAFVAVIFLMMFVGVGLGIDFMRHETERAELQAAIDRGILAAAAKTQTMDAEATVLSYIASANLAGDYEVRVTHDDTFYSRRVEAVAETRIPTYFLKLIGIDSLSAKVRGTAFEGIANVEMSLVLDISGSMARERTSVSPEALTLLQNYPNQSDLDWNGNASDVSRLDLLKVSAHKFVGDLLENSHPGSTSLSLVPYAGQVNIGETVFDMLADTRLHSRSHCVELEPDDFTTTAMPAGDRDQVLHFQWFRYEADYGFTANWGWCPSDTQRIVYFSDSTSQLRERIAGLAAHDGTGTQIGMKWGLALLDPTARRVVRAFGDVAQAAIDRGDVGDLDPGAAETDALAISSDFAKRPLPFKTPSSLKIIVLMTDGNTRFQVRPKIPPGQVGRQDDSDLKRWFKDSLGEAEGWVAGKNSSRETTSEEEARMQFRQLCRLAEENEVVVFTIGFDIAEGSTAQSDMAYCASDPAFFFDVSGAKLSDAFDSILATVTRLRLTQ